jgi:hypothetical protein
MICKVNVIMGVSGLGLGEGGVRLNCAQWLILVLAVLNIRVLLQERELTL